MRFLITGVAGFAGGHLASLLRDGGHEIFGVVRHAPAGSVVEVLRAAIAAPLEEAVMIGDVCDRATMTAAMSRYRPDGVFHLAGQSSVSAGEGDPAMTFAVNAVGTLQVLEAAGRAAHHCRVLLVSSGECYGRSAGQEPLREATPLRPVNIYGASKAAGELLARQAVDARGVDVVCARAFNHTGPRQSPRFVCADFARQVVAVERGVESVVRVGNLDAVRDFLDVRDVVRAYLRLWEQGESGEVYNIATGIGRRVGAVLDDLCALSTARPAIETVPERLRPADIPTLIGDNGRLRSLGWQPVHEWASTLAALLDDWRRR